MLPRSPSSLHSTFGRRWGAAASEVCPILFASGVLSLRFAPGCFASERLRSPPQRYLVQVFHEVHRHHGGADHAWAGVDAEDRGDAQDLQLLDVQALLQRL